MYEVVILNEVQNLQKLLERYFASLNMTKSIDSPLKFTSEKLFYSDLPH